MIVILNLNKPTTNLIRMLVDEANAEMGGKHTPTQMINGIIDLYFIEMTKRVAQGDPDFAEMVRERLPWLEDF